MLESNALVLNSLYQAIQITSVRRAFVLLYKGEVFAVDPEFRTYDWKDWCDVPVQPDDEFITTPCLRIKVPRVVLLRYFDRLPRQEVRFTRKNIYFRDKNRCQYCGRKFATRELNLDHVVPLSRGGRTSWDNVVCCCFSCNHRKGHHLPHEAGMRLIHPPAKPKWHPLLRLALAHGSTHEAWKNFLDMAYWNIELESD
jgi:5-methylcytosine-specific restriction endonuclease McrA